MKVLADTSVCIAHFRAPNPAFMALLMADEVLVHPMIVAKIARGTPPSRGRTLAHIGSLHPVRQATLAKPWPWWDMPAFMGADAAWWTGSCWPAACSHRARRCQLPATFILLMRMDPTVLAP